MSLGSFLQTHPYKRKDCLEHICKTLKLSTNGIVETLRSRIIDHVDGKTDLKDKVTVEEQIKDIAQTFKSTENKKHKTSVSNTDNQLLPPPQPSSNKCFHNLNRYHPKFGLLIVRLTVLQVQISQTQPPLFKDTQNLPSATESTLEETIISREIDEFFHEITLDGDEDDEFPGVMEAKRRRLQSPFTHVNESLWYDKSAHTQNNHDVGDPSKNDRDDGITHNQRDIAHKWSTMRKNMIRTIFMTIVRREWRF